MRRSRAGAAAFAGMLVVLVALAPAGVRASPQDLFGYGSRSSAMAGTGTSFGDDYEAVFSNPAGLSRAARRGLVVGAHGAGYAVSLDGQRFTIDAPRATSIGVQLPVPFGGVLANRIVIGAGFYTPIDVIVRGDIAYPEVPQMPVITRAKSVAVQAGIGLDLDGIVDGLRLGAGFSALASLLGDMVTEIDSTGRFGSRVETQLVATYAPILGANWARGDWSFGLVWRGELTAEFEMEVVTRDLPVRLPTLTIGGLAQYDPHAVSAEASWRPAPGWLVAGQACWRHWSAYPGAERPTSASSPAPPDPGFFDTVSPRIAVERTIRRGPFELALRGGYAYEPTPAPPARAEARYLDSDRHVLTAGVGLAWAPRGESTKLTLDLYGQLDVLAPRTHDAPAPGGTENMRTSGVIAVGGWTVGVQW